MVHIFYIISLQYLLNNNFEDFYFNHKNLNNLK